MAMASPAPPNKKPRLSEPTAEHDPAIDTAIDTAQQQQPQQASRSPSPAAHPPTPSAPGPRATALQKLYSDALAHLLKTCSYQNFASCFPTPAAAVPASMKHLHESFCEKLGAQLRQNWQGVLEERGVMRWLNELDGVVEDGRRRREKGMGGVAPHTLPAMQLYLSHLGPWLAKYSQQIQERQQRLEAENAERHQRILRQRMELEDVLKGLEDVVGKLNANATAIKPEETDALRDEARTVDEDMRE